VDDLLDVTRIARGKIELRRERVDLRETVRRTAEDFRSVIEARRVTFRVDVPEANVWAQVDPTRLAQAIGNLLHNAAKFTPAGGEVTVSLSATEAAAELTVRDDGAGMEAHELERMWEPFAQADRSLARTKGGLGLGLSLVKALVELHGGTVRARSEGPGRGAEFLITLPVAGDAPALPAPPRQRAAHASRLVLVIEDNVDAGQGLGDLLELRGHRVRVARDGRSGLAAAREARPDVVICDLGLPDMSGFDVARALRGDERLRTTRIIALSGYAQHEDRQRAREAGFDAHVAKPPDVEELMTLLGE
jgi:CheY-like chemotaxis protein/two-component sensor histidine kinase